jgi:phospholipase C
MRTRATSSRHLRARCARLAMVVLVVCSIGALVVGSPAEGSAPIRHVVVIVDENHSFDNVFGRFCVNLARCNGATTGKLANGTRIKLRLASDIVPDVGHFVGSQTTAIDGGKMDGFNRIFGCTSSSSPRYRCYTQFAQAQIPNLWRLGRAFTVSDATFEDGPVPSWGSHLDLVAQTLDGFTGDNPPDKSGSGPGWGCDSEKDAKWQAFPGGPITWVPSCVPAYSLDPTKFPYGGAYRSTPVKHVPTLMDRLDAAHLTWRIYETTTNMTTATSGGYGWAICPTFADCIYTSQKNHMHRSGGVIKDAAAGTLPAVSLVVPDRENSQHNYWSMTQGDNWIGKVVSAVEHGPQWSSTAIFITYDDCGCFYDHVAPPAGLGIRVPLVIVSPYAKAGYTDSRIASFASIDAFIEHAFGLTPLTKQDANAYDFRSSFNYAQEPLPPVSMVKTAVPARSIRYIQEHPADLDDET